MSYFERFDYWTVTELSQSVSIQVHVLDKLAPGIDNENLEVDAELVEGCPLALKIMGRLLQELWNPFYIKMKNELFTILDKDDMQKQ